MVYFSEIRINYSKRILILHYTHLGFKRLHLHHAFRKALLGIYNELCIINPTTILSNLKFVSRFIISMHLKELKFVFISYDFPVNLVSFLKFRSNFFLLNYWPSGYFTNAISVRTTEIIKKKYNLCPTHTPDYLIFLNVEPSKSFSIIKEARKFYIPSVGFCDSVEDLSVFHHWIPINTRSGISKTFILNYLNNTLTLAAHLKKKNFITYISRRLRLKNWTDWVHDLLDQKYNFRPEFKLKSGWVYEMRKLERAESKYTFY